MGKTSILLLVFFTFIFSAATSQVTGYVFTAGTATYTSITGTSPVLTGDGTGPVQDEGYANGIPIGFTFNYLGANYTMIGASTNGFASFGTITLPGFSNSLSIGGTGRPLLAPLWEDLSLANGAGLQYITTGVTGNRVFVLQWDNVLYDFGAGSASVSFQLRLYETTNVIEFIYNQLAGSVQDFSGGASIGITSAATGSGSFLSLNNSSSSPAISSVVATNTIVTRPVSGQVYRFTPPVCIAPGNLAITNITASTATINWADGSATAFEYSVSTVATPPVSGTATSFSSTIVSGLTSGTQYYLHVRKDCSGVFSGWNTITFATMCDAGTLPYTMPISSASAPALPLCVTASDDNNDGYTWRSYPSAGQGWTDQVVAYVYNINGTTSANDWLFTRGLNLTAGISYRLSFKYNNDATSLYIEKLKVAYGISSNAAAMTNMLADYTSVSDVMPKTVSIDFVPAVSGTHYIGFHVYSDADKDVLILDDISVKATPLCDIPQNLAVTVQPAGTTANLSWQAPAIGSPSGYEYAVNTSNTPPASGIVAATASGSVSNLTAYAEYYLHVRTNCSGSFSDWATLKFATIANDEACQAIELTAGGAPVCGNTTLATSVDDPYSTCSSPNSSVWFTYTATTTGTIVLVMTTPAAPAKPLRGWVTWYSPSGDCPAISFSETGSCQQFGDNGNNDMEYLLSPVLTAGNTYYIMVDGFSGDVGEYCISIPACIPVVSVNAADITSTQANITWEGSGSFILEYGLAGFTPGTGSTAGAGGTIINTSVSPQTLTGLTISTAYSVYVRQNCTVAGNGYSSNSLAANFTTLGPPPVNDNCAGAIDLVVYSNACGGATAGSTLNATASGVTPLPDCDTDHAGYDDDVWYSFTALPGQLFVTIAITSTGGDADMIAQVYTSSDNTCAGTFTSFACSDNEGPGNMPGFYSLPVTAGTKYFIRLFSHVTGVNSQFTICVTKALLINDNANSAIDLVVDAGCTDAVFTNIGATQTIGEPSGTCSSTTGYATVWYKFVAPAGGDVRISTATGSGNNTLVDSRLSLFHAVDVNDYTSFSVIACDEDGGSGSFADMSVVYATGLNPGGTYYIQVDKKDNLASDGTFCITVDKLSPAMLSMDNTCNSSYQTPVGTIPDYKGWVPLLDAGSKLIALVRNQSVGGVVSAYTISQNVKSGPVRQDPVSGEYYLNRNYKITNTSTGTTAIDVQLFFTDDELAALQAVDPAAILNRLRVTRQAGTDCQPDFNAANGTNNELSQTGYTSQNGVSWITFRTTSFSNFYVHSTKSRLTTKVFLQGAFNAGLSRHKDVTPAWANVMNTYALNQPYNTTAFGNYAGTESVPAGFFTSTPADTDILDWVLIEIKTSGGTIRSQRAAFIREDGQVVDLDGVSPVTMYGLSSGNSHITIRHRNHLGISTQNTRFFTASALGVSIPAPSDFNFSTESDANIFGDALAFKLINVTNVMIGANANSNNNVRYGGSGNDPGSILVFLGSSPLIIINNAYTPNDLNLDGSVKYGGQNNEPAFLLYNVLDGVPLQFVTEQRR